MSLFPVLGVDVSKATLDVQLGCQKHKSFHLRVSNDLEGFVHLETWLKQQGHQQVHVCLEATGTYSDAFAHYMYAREHPVSLINPFRMKAFRQSEGLTNKSDRLDAWLLARYGEQKQPERWHPVRLSFQQLTQDLGRSDDLKLMIQQEKNRLENQRLDQESRDDITAHIEWLEQRVTAWLKCIKQRFVQTWQQEEQDHTTGQDQTTPSDLSPSDESPVLDAVGMLNAVDEIKGFDVLSS